ncbi:hypothetical protein [Paraburkholderia caledonica]|uniref:Uncharacterized protein n=1 Tax=Paraburkholderia caledonica TaxID=134536 RepID=A0ABU1KX10_9BURK|nr:hypothetical protein [Paraburkholderia caledonica]MDR6375503.1 hypothetical protein [Paraburkholderia caledonica]
MKTPLFVCQQIHAVTACWNDAAKDEGAAVRRRPLEGITSYAFQGIVINRGNNDDFIV